MIKQLNHKQRKFIEYLVNEHECIGYDQSMPKMLLRGNYNDDYINAVLRNFQELKIDGSQLQRVYGKPTKYLK